MSIHWDKYRSRAWFTTGSLYAPDLHANAKLITARRHAFVKINTMIPIALPSSLLCRATYLVPFLPLLTFKSATLTLTPSQWRQAYQAPGVCKDTERV